MTLYSIWDNQCGRYMATGRNSISLEDAAKAILNHIGNDDTEEDREIVSSLSLKEKMSYIKAHELRVVRHKEVIDGDLNE